MKKLRITKNIRGNVHCLDIGHVGEFDDDFARQLIAADGAVEVVDPPVEVEPAAETAMLKQPETALKRASPSAARRQKL